MITLIGIATPFDIPTVEPVGLKEAMIEQFAQGCFDRSLSEPERKVVALWDHKDEIVLGSTASGSLRLQTDANGLHFELDLLSEDLRKYAAAVRNYAVS